MMGVVQVFLYNEDTPEDIAERLQLAYNEVMSKMNDGQMNKRTFSIIKIGKENDVK